MRPLCAWGVLAVLASTVAVQAADPALSTLLPRGAKVGTEVDVHFFGQRLQDVEDVVFHGEGITLLSIEPDGNRRAKGRFAIAPDCRVGMHAMRLRTKSGVSNLRLFSVGTLEEFGEVEPNNTLDAAQAFVLGTTINGTAEQEDVDFFSFEATAGQRVTIELEGMRLGETNFDPFIALLDERGFELASCDDSALLRQDPIVSAVIPSDGIYVVQVRESAYRGNVACSYRMHVGTYAHPTATMPLGGRPGETLEVALLGDPAGARSMNVTLDAARDVESSGGWFGRGTIGMLLEDAPSPNWFRVVDLDNALETEPNGSHGEANPITVPVAINGVIDEGDVYDCFSFEAKKDEAFEVAVYARRLRTPLDPVVSIHRRGAGRVAGNDDDGGPDSRLDFKAPEDGEYVVTIRDHLRRGGADFAYRIEIAPQRPAVWLQAPRRVQHVVVPRNGRSAILLTANRYAFGGPLVTSLSDLPDGVVATAPRTSGRVSAVPVVFTATADAERSHGLARIDVAHENTDRGIRGGFRHDAELTLGRNQVVLHAHTIDRLPVAVVDEVPFSIEVDVPKTPLVRNGSKQLVVRVARDEGFEGEIRLNVPFSPPGVGAGRGVRIPADKDVARIPLNANGNAPLESWEIVVIAESNAPGGGAYRVSSALVPLTIAAPWVAFEPQGTTVEQGAATTMPITVTKRDGFAGTATVELRGLPHNVAARPIEIDGSAETITFEITTQADSPAGRHKNLFCIARFETDGESVVHRLPAGELRIDKPLPAKAAAAPKREPAPKPKPAGPTAKPLTRLEKLRKEHEERRRAELEETGTEEDDA